MSEKMKIVAGMSYEEKKRTVQIWYIQGLISEYEADMLMDV